jgi:uncharacterized protein
VRLYLDASALVKLVVAEAETAALRAYLRRHRRDELVTSAVSRVEVVRAVMPAGPAAASAARRLAAGVAQLTLSRSILDSAAALQTATPLRTLDAIHLASAQRIGPSLRAVVTYDATMAATAQELALTAIAPT